MPRLNQADLEACISVAKKEGSEVLLGRKENALREQALILYHEHNYTINRILKRLWDINSLEDEDRMTDKSYFNRSSESTLSGMEKNRQKKIARLPLLLDWLKLSQKDIEV
jgi:hypothetical protein